MTKNARPLILFSQNQYRATEDQAIPLCANQAMRRGVNNQGAYLSLPPVAFLLERYLRPAFLFHLPVAALRLAQDSKEAFSSEQRHQALSL